jgi:hypothetical protein
MGGDGREMGGLACTVREASPWSGRSTRPGDPKSKWELGDGVDTDTPKNLQNDVKTFAMS